MKPNLTWFIDDTTPVYKEAFIGAYESTTDFSLKLKVVNNYLGVEPVENIRNGKLLLMFKNYEDSSLLNHLKIELDNSKPLPIEIIGDRGYVKITRVLSGDYQHPSDCTLSIKISFDENINVRNDLKQLILDIIY